LFLIDEITFFYNEKKIDLFKNLNPSQ